MAFKLGMTAIELCTANVLMLVLITLNLSLTLKLFVRLIQLGFFSCIVYILLIPFWKCGLSDMGKATAAQLTHKAGL